MNYTVTEGNYLRFGLQSVKDGVIFTFAGEKEDVCEVILYDRSLKVAGRVEAPAAFCRGAVRSVYIHGLKADHLLYNYEINGEIVPDPYASKIAGREKWDDARRAECDFLVCGSFEEKEYEWLPGDPEKRNGHVQASCQGIFHGFREKGKNAWNICGSGGADSLSESVRRDDGGADAGL